VLNHDKERSERSRGSVVIDAGQQASASFASVRARLGAAQADLAAEKVKAMRGKTLPTAEVEALWTRKLRAFRNRILAIPSRVSYLSLRQREMAEARATGG
jgi:phage terminase Nu1 subunit (DNA packaging protein)